MRLKTGDRNDFESLGWRVPKIGKFSEDSEINANNVLS
jgi:hypothetical protein